MKKIALILALLVLASTASAAVRVYVEDVNGLAAIKYECTDGETVRAFGLNVTVDEGTITAVSDYHVGMSEVGNLGYGIFPGSFSRTITVDANDGEVKDENWLDEDYSPVAYLEDYPDDTLGGLGTDGVTLEFAGLWEVGNDNAKPASSGTLCMLTLSDTAVVSIAANVVRAGTTGVVLVDPTEVATMIPYEEGAATVTP